MGLIDRLLRREKRSTMTMAELDRMMDQAALGLSTATGRFVDADSSLNSVAVYACVRLLAETIASLPLRVYRRLPEGGKASAPEHPLYQVIHDCPNPEMTSLELREALVGHVALRGNAYCEIQRSYGGDVVALWPLRPDRMSVVRDASNRLAYSYRMPDGMDRPFVAENILHLRGLSSNGIVGYSPIELARQAVGLSLATEEYAGRFFGNDSRPGGILKHPAKLTPEAAARLKTSWESAHRGLSNSQRVAVLEEGVEWQQIGIAPAEAQFLESRKFQLSEIARIFRIPPHMIGDLERATFSNIEEQSIEFVVNTVRPWCERLEQRMGISLLAPDDRQEYFVEHVIDGLLRGNIQSRYAAYSIGRQNGWLSADDVRELENMNPLPDGQGKTYLIPLNMAPVGSVEQLKGEAESQEEPPASDEPALARAVATLSTRIMTPDDVREASINARRRIAASYRRLIEDSSSRILRREEQDVLKRADQLLSRGDVPGFLRWLEEHYQAQGDFGAYVRRTFLPVFLSLGDQVHANAAEQVGADARMDDAIESFILQYTDTATGRYTGSSLGQLRALTIDAQRNGDDPQKAVSTRVEEWLARRPGKLAMTHTVRESNAVAKETWVRAGVRRLVWRTHGENCSFCNNLNGKTAGIMDAFVPEGGDVQSGDQTLKPRGKVGHAPLHLGCDCGIDPA